MLSVNCHGLGPKPCIRDFFKPENSIWMSTKLSIFLLGSKATPELSVTSNNCISWSGIIDLIIYSSIFQVPILFEHSCFVILFECVRVVQKYLWSDWVCLFSFVDLFPLIADGMQVMLQQLMQGQSKRPSLYEDQ